jgi:hypothetical protein
MKLIVELKNQSGSSCSAMLLLKLHNAPWVSESKKLNENYEQLYKLNFFDFVV